MPGISNEKMQLINNEIYNAYLGALYPYDIERFKGLKKVYAQVTTKESSTDLDNATKTM